MKTIRKLMCLLTVALLVVCMVVPALATASGSGTKNGYHYTYTLTRGTSSTVATLKNTANPTNLGINITNSLYYDLTKTYGESTGSASGYATLTTSADNIFTVDGVPVRAEIQEATAKYWVNSSLAVMATD